MLPDRILFGSGLFEPDFDFFEDFETIFEEEADSRRDLGVFETFWDNFGSSFSRFRGGEG